MNKHKLYIWEPTLSPHKLAFFRALQLHNDIEFITQISHEGLLKDRQAMGWELNSLINLPTIVAPTSEHIEEIVSSSHPDSVHVFSGIHWVPTIVTGLKCALRYHRKFAIMSEPRASEGIKGFARRVHSWVTEHEIRKKAQFILAIGANGPKWFSSVGYNPDKVFPFAYFLAPPNIPKMSLQREDGLIRLGYVGRMNKLKGFELFLKSIAYTDLVAECHIAGSGEINPNNADLYSYGNVDVKNYGILPITQIPELLQKIDILIQPSLTEDDGWAAVVSEALFCGAAVITSHKVGASICLHENIRGAILRDLTPRALGELINTMSRQNIFNRKSRLLRQNWALKNLSDEAGAQKLVDILHKMT